MSDFTLAQQAQIRQYLGYADLYRYKNTRLEGVIAGVGTIGPDAVALVVADLAAIAQIEAKILETTISITNVKKVDDVEFFPALQGMKMIRTLGRMYVGRISITVGVPIYSDIFGTQGYLGDTYSASGLGSPGLGRGGVTRLG
jgi:hypothetical protein